MQYRVLRADPAGNITLFVLDEVERTQRAALAERLMKALPAWKIEQVAFLCADVPAGADGRMEMMGGEFCGNATRAFAAYLAGKRGERQSLRLAVSGCDHLVRAEADPRGGTASSEMPLPRAVRSVTVGGVRGTLVDLGGIAHFVAEHTAPDAALLSAAEPLFAGIPDLAAYGVMFLSEDGAMVPLVKVVATDTLVWEGSCGSGCLACAVAQSEGLVDGSFAREYRQPAGTLRAEAARRGGEVVGASIGGSVALGEPETVTV